ncbi:MAG: tripartite tricarboxylate transporter TctB family protein [Achromobacter sp.]|uniref:tripartite tricarboxylate transporter TctB family protein n=1 Tax=unclassified Achromobacter TaxID=2626865 RepID=UPI000E732140|nr:MULTISPECIES: tripartite tricarboxylate transporter TctB family protein [unclassified Achromobacter]AYD63030.1 tripartite tricarboxylate transporter TctB family protein [Achromobacter sp. B7]MDX3987770.1 tripartite tricarboxylate transporter TctB family protein [Achromobacter sp.]
MQLRNRQDFWSGVMFIALGLGFAWQASSYQMGTAARMGPGYFPFWLGIVLALLGAIVLLGSLSKKAQETHVDKFDWRIVFLVVGSVVLYGFILKPLGIYLSVFILVVVSSLASHEFSLKVAVANAVFLVVFSYLAFVKGLGLIFPLWPSFLGMN